MSSQISTNPESAAQFELLSELAPIAEANLSLLLPIEKAWQPTDYLPDLTAPGTGSEQLERFRKAFRRPALSDEALVVLVGGMVTEEALTPNYAISSLNLIARDETGIATDGWSQSDARGWTAEEKSTRR